MLLNPNIRIKIISKINKKINKKYQCKNIICLYIFKVPLFVSKKYLRSINTSMKSINVKNKVCFYTFKPTLFVSK